MEKKIKELVENKGWELVSAVFRQSLGWADEWTVKAKRETSLGWVETVVWAYIDGGLYYGKYERK